MWDDRRRDGGTNSTLRIKEQEKRLTLNEHDDDDDELIPSSLNGMSSFSSSLQGVVQ